MEWNSTIWMSRDVSCCSGVFPIELWCRSLSHRYFCLVAVQHSHSGKNRFQKKKELQIYQKRCFTGCHYTWIYKLFFHHLHHNASSFQTRKEITSSSCSCPVGQCSRTSLVFRKTYWMLWLLLIFLLSSTIRKWEHHMIRWMNAYKVYKGGPNTSKKVRVEGLSLESCRCLWLDIPYIVMIDHQDMPYRVMANFT